MVDVARRLLAEYARSQQIVIGSNVLQLFRERAHAVEFASRGREVVFLCGHGLGHSDYSVLLKLQDEINDLSVGSVGWRVLHSASGDCSQSE